MNNPRLAQRYAKSLIDIGTELKQLDTVHNDVLFLKSIVVKSRDFVLMLNSPIINPDKKYLIIEIQIFILLLHIECPFYF